MFQANQKHKVAVIGSGISGISSAWFLSQKHDVTLFEKESTLGGHTNTRDVQLVNGEKTAVDTGFIVYNEPNYPLLTAMFDHLKVATYPTNMSFAVSVDQGRLEYAGSNLDTLFAQRRNIFSPRHWRMIANILRFNKQAKADLINGLDEKLTLGDYLKQHGFGKAMQHDYLLPMAAAIWSCPTETMAQFPARSFLQFFANHGLLDIKDRPQWATVVGGARTYLDKILALNSFKVVKQGISQVQLAKEANQPIILTSCTGVSHEFDQVVFACHGDEAAKLLPHTDFALLKNFTYQFNQAWLHTDVKQMPKIKSAWAAWNYLSGKNNLATREVAVTYWMNRLQPLGVNTDIFVTLNPITEPDADQVIEKIDYFHPVFDQAAVAAQADLIHLQGHKNCWFAGAYTGYGFHEDGLASAAKIAGLWEIDLPWEAE